LPVTVQWSALERLLNSFDAEKACEHGLGPLAAHFRRLRGEPVPDGLAREERAASAANLIAPSLLSRARQAYDGRLMLLKGPELSIRYPQRARRFGDLDLLADDADTAQSALLAAGFRLQERDWPPEGYDEVRRPHYHLQPLEWPGLGLRIEIHRRVKWPEGLPPPRNEELFEAAVPASIGVDGLLTPHPDHHAVLLVSHAWGEVPMRTLRELVDALAFIDEGDRDAARRVAERWGIGRGWQTTVEAAEWVVHGEREPAFVRIWARYLRDLREPTVIETHVQEWLAPFWLTSFGAALRLSAAAITRDFRPEIGQSWSEKLSQMRRALLHPLSSKADQNRRYSVTGGRDAQE